MLILSLDPSINHMGWALFRADEGPVRPVRPWRLVQFGTLNTVCLKGEPIADRIIYVTDNLTKTLRGFLAFPFRLKAIVIEEPQLWGAFKSVASQHSGSLLSLYMLTGALLRWAWEFATDQVLAVPVSKWKGQLPKRITTKRSEAFWKVKFDSSDSADAAGLGTWYLKTKGYRYGIE